MVGLVFTTRCQTSLLQSTMAAHLQILGFYNTEGLPLSKMFSGNQPHALKYCTCKILLLAFQRTFFSPHFVYLTLIPAQSIRQKIFSPVGTVFPQLMFNVQCLEWHMYSRTLTCTYWKSDLKGRGQHARFVTLQMVWKPDLVQYSAYTNLKTDILWEWTLLKETPF